MPDQYQRIVRSINKLTNYVGQIVHMGTVYEVGQGGDRIRMVIGKDQDGKDVLGPWLPTGNTMYGGARERRFFKKGQNILMLRVNGDAFQGITLPYSRNKDYDAPDHANETGQDEETYQLEDLRVRKTKDCYEIWLEPPKKKKQQQQQSTSGTSTGADEKEEPHKQKLGQAKMKLKIHNNGGITGRVGKNRFAAHSKGAKIKAGSDFAAVVNGKLICSRPWEIGKDPIPDDDK